MVLFSYLLNRPKARNCWTAADKVNRSRNRCSSMALTDLPNEVLFQIFSFLDGFSLKSVQLSTKRFCDVANSLITWVLKYTQVQSFKFKYCLTSLPLVQSLTWLNMSPIGKLWKVNLNMLAIRYTFRVPTHTFLCSLFLPEIPWRFKFIPRGPLLNIQFLEWRLFCFSNCFKINSKKVVTREIECLVIGHAVYSRGY